MTACLKKNKKVVHNHDFFKSFNLCNDLLNDPTLKHPDFTKLFLLTTDASNYAIGAVFSQGAFREDLPVAYASKRLNPAECHYSSRIVPLFCR